MSPPGRWLRLSAIGVLPVVALLAALIAALPSGARGAQINLRQPLVVAPGAVPRRAHGLRQAAPTPAALNAAVSQITGLPASQVAAVDACAAPRPGQAACAAKVLVRRLGRDLRALIHPRVARRATFTQIFPRARQAAVRGQAAAAPATATATPAGATSTAPPPPGTPAYLQQAYDLGYLSQTVGSADTVAVVDAGNDANAESDLATYRSTYGLPACTTANGCFRKVNQSGAASPLPPSAGSGWETEISLDLDAISALCPNCHIVLVQANSAAASDLNAGISAAIGLGANQISNSWSTTSATPAGTATFPGASVIAATGDHGYPGAGSDNYPAAFPGVTAAGGTTLSGASSSSSLRGYAEAAWSLNSSGSGWGGASGCDLNEAKPPYQSDTGCSGRSYADVSADANPDTGLRVYDAGNGGWTVAGGTSLASPLIAAFEALTGVAGASAGWAYGRAALLNDPATGSSGSCAAAIAYICAAGTGYDGPTGAGSISGAIVSGAPGIGGPAVGDGSTNSYTRSVDATTAGLSGGAYPNGLDTTAYWQYGTTTSYGAQTASADIGAGAAPAGTTATLTGLTPGTTYHYRLVAANSAGTSYGYDATLTTTAVSNAPPLNTAAPTITGQALQGQTLSALTGTWSPSNPTFAYQWRRSTDGGTTWSQIPGATGSTYTVAGSDLGDTIDVQIAASDANGSMTATAGAVGPVRSGAPAATSQAAISGPAEQGQVLTAVSTWNPTGTAYSYRWQRSGDGGTTWSDITRATSSSYTATAADLGDEVRVIVSGSNAYGQGSSTTAALGPVAHDAPINTAAPTATGSPQRTATLSASPGAWSGVNVTYGYQWQRSADGGTTWTGIENATQPTYSLGVADEGDTVRALVTATNASGSATAASAATTPVAPFPPASTAAPTVAGTAQRGATLTAAQGTWTGPGTTYAYQWQRDSGEGYSDIPQATSVTYAVGFGDEGATIRVAVSATNADATISQASAPTAAVTGAPPVDTTAPAVNGTPRRGTTLSADVGTWSGAENVYSYQWQRSPDGSAWTGIAAATGSTYTVTAADEGAQLRVLIAATNPDGSASAPSAPTAPAAAVPPVASAPPTISPGAQRGLVLTATLGTWSGPDNAYAYQWQRSVNGTTWTSIAGATGSYYTLAIADEGDQVRVLVSAANSDATASAASSPAGPVVAAAPVNSALPALTGTAQRSSNLTATAGTWSGNTNTYTCQWQRSADSGTTWTAISGANGFNYTMTVGDEGDLLRALITAMNPDATVTAASAPTPAVAGAPALSTSPPTIAGAAVRGTTISSSQGGWSGIGNAYTYQWQRSVNGTTWTNIPGATAFQYALAVADEGDAVRLLITAANLDGSVSAASAPTAAVAAAPPVDAAVPALAAGSAQRGVSIDSAYGTWSGVGNGYAYQWQRSTDGTTWSAIPGATNESYTPAVADEGNRLRVAVTVSNLDGTATADSAASPAVTATPPVSTAAPILAGSAQRGQTLTSTTGTWLGQGNGYSFQWQRSADRTTWTNISGATTAGYPIGPADENSALRLVVTASNADASASAASVATAVVPSAPPVDITLPIVSGVAQRGYLLSAAPGTWQGIGNSLAYQWQRSADGATWTNITGQTTSTYIVTAGDEGLRIRMLVTAANLDGTATAASPATAGVIGSPPAASVAPMVAGIAQRGNSLSSTDGTWSGADDVLSQQWQRSADGSTWVSIPGATLPLYTLGAADEGQVVRLLVTVSNPDGTASAASPPTPAVTASPPANTTLPTIAGPPQRLQTLVATSGSWSGAGDVLSYAWQRSADGGTTWAPISGATGPAYTLTRADESDVLRVLVAATNPDGAVSSPSAPSAAVQSAPPAAIRAPTVQGIARLGSSLLTDGGTWTPSDVTLAFAWQRGDPVNGFAPIPGATGPSYTVTGADIGAMIRVVVTGTDPDGAITAASAASAAVGRPPGNLVVPAVPSGTPIQGNALTPDPGTWDSPATYAYSWLRCPAGATAVDARCAGVGGGSTYALSVGDVGMEMAVQVTATSAGGTSTATSGLTRAIAGAVLTNTAPPSISGDPQVPNTLYANPGSWSPTLTSAAYSWERCAADGVTGCAVAAADTAHYALTPADSGHAIVLVVTASSPGRTATAQSPPLAVSAQPLPQAAILPTVSGNPVRTFTLSATGGSWSNSPMSLAYQWERCDATGRGCAAVAGATGSTYQLAAADEGHEVTVAVTAANTAGSSTAAAVPSATIGSLLPTLLHPPALSTATVAQGVPVSVGGASWQIPSPTTYAYAWERCDATGQSCQTISGATATTYLPVAADVGHTLVAAITASDVDGAVTGPTAASSVVLPAAPRWRALPTLSATGGAVGVTVTVTPGTWSGPAVSTDTAALMRCTSVCVSTGSAGPYTIAAGDIGAILRVRETATNAGGTTVVWSPQYVGPVTSAVSGSVVLAAGRAVVRNDAGMPLATALLSTTSVMSTQVVGPAAHGAHRGGSVRQVTIRRIAHVRGALRAWVCAVAAGAGQSAAPPPCTRQIALGRSARLTLPAAMTGRVRVVVVGRARRRSLPSTARR